MPSNHAPRSAGWPFSILAALLCMLPQLLFIVGCGPGGEQSPATSSAQPEVSAAGQESAESEDPQSYAFKMPRPEIGPIPADWQRKTVQEKLRTLDELAVNADFPAAYQQLAHALGDAEPGVREAALARATELPLNLQTALLAQALEDPIANIRYQALDQLKEVEGPEALPVLRQGITSPLEDVKILSANQLTLRGDKPSLEVLFEGLRDPDPKIREEVQENLDFLLSINFRSYHHARQWWAENRAQYDEELFREEG